MRWYQLFHATGIFLNPLETETGGTKWARSISLHGYSLEIAYSLNPLMPGGNKKVAYT